MMKHLELEPARAKAKRPDELWSDPMWIAEEKLDGWRFLMHFGGDLDRVYMTGRRTSKRTMRLSEKGLCAPCLWPSPGVCDEIGYTVLDGEVKSPTGDWRDVAGIMNVEPEKALARIAEIGEPRYVAWDVLFHDGVDVRERCLADRLGLLAPLIMSKIDHELIDLVTGDQDKRALYDSVVARGGEGVVLKDLASAYGESGAWIKVKKSPTVDVIVTGFTQAKHGLTGQYSGQVGAAKVSVYGADGRTLIEVAKVSGMDDETRLDMTRNPGRWLGVVVEVEAQEFSKDRLRSPRYKRRRDDANARSATFTKMLADLSQERRGEPEQLSLL